MRHLVLIRTSAGNSVIKVPEGNGARVARAIRIREARGETIYKVDCAASCPCPGGD